jgi:hypothetical protein
MEKNDPVWVGLFVDVTTGEPVYAWAPKEEDVQNAKSKYIPELSEPLPNNEIPLGPEATTHVITTTYIYAEKSPG